jgi:hypothetical protein
MAPAPSTVNDLLRIVPPGARRTVSLNTKAAGRAFDRANPVVGEQANIRLLVDRSAESVSHAGGVNRNLLGLKSAE